MTLRGFKQPLRCGLLLIVFVSSASTLLCSAETWESLGRVTSTRRLPNGIELTAGKAKVAVTGINDSVVRIRVTQNGVFPKDASWAVLEEAVSKAPAVQITEDANTADI